MTEVNEFDYETPRAVDAHSNNSLDTFNSDTAYQRRLSSISKKFDRGDKGYLDETEQALRRLDSQNTGQLDVHKVYGIMEHLQKANRENADLLSTLQQESKRNGSLRRGIAMLCVFTLLLTMANIGTSFAAARLAKDTQVGPNGDLQSTSTGLRLGTTSKEVSMEMVPYTDERRRQRHLQTLGENVLQCQDAADNTTTCKLQGEINREEAQGLYDALCPERNPAGRCNSAGVTQVTLTCNGHMSTIFGGTLLPDTPPSEQDGFMVYPSPDGGYFARGAKRLYGGFLPCFQEFFVGMYCPNQTIIEESGDDSCLVFSAGRPSLICPGDVIVCGRTPV